MTDTPQQKSFSVRTKFLIVFIPIVLIALVWGLVRALGDTVTVGLTLKTNQSLSEGLVGHWTFDGQAMVSNVADASGSGNHGALSGQAATTTAPGRLGQALLLDGTDDSVAVGSVAGTVRTISFWIKADDTTSRKIINIDGTDQVELNGSSQVAATSFPAATVYVDGVVGSTVSTGWHHVVITDSTGVSATNFVIGSVTGAYFDGIIDDVRIYDRALSAEEVGRLYDLGIATEINTTIPPGPSLEDGLVGYWTFDGPTMLQNIGDSSIEGNNGRLFGQAATTTAPGRLGQALSLDGDDDYVDIGTDSSLKPALPVSMAAWVKLTEDQGIARNIVENDDLATTQTRYYGVQMQVAAAGALTAHYGDGTGGTSNDRRSKTGTTVLDLNEWYHLAIVVRDDTDMSLYVNGVDDDGTYSGAAPFPMAYSANNGHIGSSFAGYTSALVDDVRIYDRALTTSDIEELYQLGVGVRVNPN